ncbi:hypothetical protein PALA35_01465 [Pseudomonas aeruginosa]|nr:hypothetical protein Y89_2872 [Pseudomonas aeruginosa]ETV31425.1 hypothetical protein Q046_04613 [Pseudomonas aeruginosa BWHPSA041]AXO28826.1 hypothetical protein Ysp71_2878 [Pseudomonas aeruginosa]AXS71401.1 hypothetical protein CTT40_02826 [Pseudomonas aeruginosa]WBI10527.1 hypothetical protein PALA20_00191 [Pseudomonas aeruginosa]
MSINRFQASGQRLAAWARQQGLVPASVETLNAAAAPRVHQPASQAFAETARPEASPALSAGCASPQVDGRTPLCPAAPSCPVPALTPEAVASLPRCLPEPSPGPFPVLPSVLLTRVTAMTDQPQLMTEEIELIPHPMDAWRAALNALIACAPGDSAAIAVHLAEARQQALVFVDRTAATKGTRKLVDRLMLIGAGRIVGDRLQSQAAPATVASLNRRVTARMTVVVNGTDYDVSTMPGVMVGDMIRVDPNNMPPALNPDAVLGGFFQPGRVFSLPEAGTPSGPDQPSAQGNELPPVAPATDRRGGASQPANAECQSHPAAAESQPAPHTHAQAPQTAPQKPDQP